MTACADMQAVVQRMPSLSALPFRFGPWLTSSIEVPSSLPAQDLQRAGDADRGGLAGAGCSAALARRHGRHQDGVLPAFDWVASQRQICVVWLAHAEVCMTMLYLRWYWAQAQVTTSG